MVKAAAHTLLVRTKHQPAELGGEQQNGRGGGCGAGRLGVWQLVPELAARAVGVTEPSVAELMVAAAIVLLPTAWLWARMEWLWRWMRRLGYHTFLQDKPEAATKDQVTHTSDFFSSSMIINYFVLMACCGTQ